VNDLGEEEWGKRQEGFLYDADLPLSTVGEPVERFEDLRVWQAGMNLATTIYELTALLPASEKFGLTSQLRRAAVSVPSNIAEGWGRGSRNDYLRFLRIARGSLYEVKTQLLIATRVFPSTGSASESAVHDCESVRRQLQALISALER